MANEEKKETKIVRGYSLSPVNLRWLNQKAAKKMLEGERMSASEVLDRIVTAARVVEAAHEIVKKAKQ